MKDLPICSLAVGTMLAANGIPKHIMQTAKTADLPLACQSAAVNAKLLNLGFEYCFFANPQMAAFIQDGFPPASLSAYGLDLQRRFRVEMPLSYAI
jgi:hypothetical protein